MPLTKLFGEARKFVHRVEPYRTLLPAILLAAAAHRRALVPGCSCVRKEEVVIPESKAVLRRAARPQGRKGMLTKSLTEYSKPVHWAKALYTTLPCDHS